MSKHKIYFYGTDSGAYVPRIETFVNCADEISVRIEDENDPEDFHIMSLDISTAIRFAKTLRTEINKAKEVSNG